MVVVVVVVMMMAMLIPSQSRRGTISMGSI
jgi:hypothetical protein